ncbi:hypothetical protein RPMA_14530 [Tardiphaga alba]|uniref:Secreted protein n=1 Tax=Tardiphaga alba TaxID=340268 RepID=A0ABX8A851_9BRAD|nr:DUF6719 family protein [Tardiphaga alba]QUS39914.1 hypothetical protein RPMA_14530 [Tardiphaga alba]
MRIGLSLLSGILVTAAAAMTFASSCDAQSIRTSEPLILAPYESALVYDGSCSAGKVLKVTGSIRGLRRKKTCVALGDTQASLGFIIQ